MQKTWNLFVKKLIKKIFFFVKRNLSKVIPNLISPTSIISVQDAYNKGVISIDYTNHSYTKTFQIAEIDYDKYETILYKEYTSTCNHIGFIYAKNIEIHSKYSLVSFNNNLITELFDDNKISGHDKNYLRYFIPNAKTFIDRAIIVSTYRQWNYYHFLLDFVPRVIHSINSYGNDSIYIVANTHTKFQDDFYMLTGIKKNLLLLDNKDCVKIEDAIIPTFTSQIGNPTLYTVKLIRDFFSKNLLNNQDNIKYPKHIYISRAKSKSRRVLNESLLEFTLAKNSIQTVFLEDMSLLEQYRLFKDIDLIISSHGAGLANLVFCKKNTKVIELFSKDYIEACFYRISKSIDLNYNFIMHESENINNDIIADISKIESILQTCAL